MSYEVNGETTLYSIFMNNYMDDEKLPFYDEYTLREYGTVC